MRDILRSHIGINILHHFVEQTEEYLNADSTVQTELRDGSFDRFMAYVLLRNSDQNKYGSVMHGLVSQFSMEHDQYPRTLIAATDILTNHRHDNYNKKKGPWKENDDKNKTNNEEEKRTETSFAQNKSNVMCYCCGKTGHKSPECSEKDTRPKSEWAIRKAELFMQKTDSNDNDNNDDDISVATTATNKSTRQSGWSGLQAMLLTPQSDAMKQMNEVITLDNGSTMSIFCNPDLVKNIHDADVTLE